MTSTRLFKQLNIVPRWIIFTLDLLICLLSITAAYIIKYNFDFSALNFMQFSQNVLIILTISTIVFLP